MSMTLNKRREKGREGEGPLEAISRPDSPSVVLYFGLCPRHGPLMSKPWADFLSDRLSSRLGGGRKRKKEEKEGKGTNSAPLRRGSTASSPYPDTSPNF